MKRFYRLGFSGIVLWASVIGHTLQAAEVTETETAQANSAITVYKSPNCGCCADWADHLENNGFAVQIESVNDLQAVKNRYGIPRKMMSCHTAVINGLVVEGHVPAGDIRTFLASPAAGLGGEVIGLSVPGMPHGAPGMETGRKDSYAVLTFNTDGDTEVFESYGNY